MPTDEELKAYVLALPDIYKHILMAFPRCEPTRYQGYGLFLQTIAEDVENQDFHGGIEKVILACKELERKGLVEIKNNIFVQPTLLGERFITAAWGPPAPPLEVEPLPPLPV